MWLMLFALLAADDGKRHAPLSPQEIVKRLDASDRTYKINEQKSAGLDWYLDNAAGFWPREKDRQLQIPAMVVGEDGKRGLGEWQAPKGSAEAIDAAQKVYHSKDWAAAEKAYGEVVGKFPGQYQAWLSFGECAEFQGKAAVALERYEKATKLVPLDVQGWLHRGSALLGMGKRADAIKMYAHALMLRPHSQAVADAVDQKGKRLGLKVRTDLVLPAARVEEDGNDVVMTMIAAPHWVAWASCKALWIGEEAHRKEMTGRKDHVFTNVEEEECLLNMAASYEAVTKTKAGYSPDSTAQLVWDVVQAELLSALVLYEIASRVDPDVTLTLPDEYPPKIEELIRRFVLVPK